MNEFESPFSRSLPISEPIHDADGKPDPVDSALRQIMLSYKVAKVDGPEPWLHDQAVEYAYADTRPDTDPRRTFVNYTGAWGQGWQTESETTLLAHLAGDLGLELYIPSLPGHGRSSDLPGGWGNNLDEKTDFDRAASIGREFIKQKIGHPVILSGWSMGGQTILRLAAANPEMVRGVILMDTPLFPMDFATLAKNFFTYPLHQKNVETEDPFPRSVPSPGLGIFSLRFKDRNQPEGMPLKTVYKTAKSMSQSDLTNELITLSRHQIPILAIHGQNDYVVPQGQMNRAGRLMARHGGNITQIQLFKAGHAFPAERPRAAASVMENWLVNQHLVDFPHQSETTLW